MVSFLFELYTTSIKYKNELINSGFNIGGIEQILEIREALMNSSSKQELMKKQRPKLTEDRIIILNTCYSTLTLINDAAQRVFRDDFAKQKQYVFSPTPKSKDKPDFIGEVAPAKTVVIGTTPYEAKKEISFTNTGEVTLLFYLGTSNEPKGSPIVLDNGEEMTVTMESLFPTGTTLLVENNDPAKSGSYEIRIIK